MLSLILYYVMFSLPLASQPSDLLQPLRSLVESELAFSRASAAEGMRAAFLEYLAPDGVIFRPTPVPGRTWFEERPDLSGKLTWQPELADISRAGDMGYTTGPYELAAGGEVQHGHFVTVWKKVEDGAWRVAIDHGIAHGPPETEYGGVTFPAKLRSPSKPDEAAAEAQRKALRETDEAFSRASAGKGFLQSFIAVAADDVRVYRVNSFPVTGKDRAREILAGESGSQTWQPSAAAVSSAADLGYTYGLIEKDGRVSSSYLRVWRRQTGGPWKLVLDLSHPLPATAQPDKQ